MLRSGAPGALKKKRAPEEYDSDGSSSSSEEEDHDNDDDQVLSQAAMRKLNERGIRDGDIAVHRAPVMRFLAVPKEVLSKPFRLPCPRGWRMPAKEVGLGANNTGRKTLGMTRIRATSNFSSQFKTVGMEDGGLEQFADVEDDLYLKYQQDPVVLYEGEGGHQVVVEPIIGKFLREHQREGIAFLFECVAGLRAYNGCGCILADDMGLGKTLQSITLIYTVLRQGLEKDKPLAKRVIVVTPTSLVRNWDNEIEKWLKGRVKALALAESNREEVEKRIKRFVTTTQYQVLIISYDTFRLNEKLFSGEGACDLLICDEAHRLKNDQTKTSKALDSLHTKRRVLLSGTPMQNDLGEFYAMVNFCNPEVLGTLSQFNKKYQSPILIGREPDATEKEVKLSEERSNELSDIVNQFILRRTNSLLSKHLPPKLTQIVCVNLTEMQKKMYRHIVYAKLSAGMEEDYKKTVSTATLASINALKKLCNHPQLLYEKESIYKQPGARPKKHGFGLDEINQYFPPEFLFGNGGGRGGRSYRGGGGSSQDSHYEWSGKFMLVRNMLVHMRRETDDRMVIVSNYTQTLDLFSAMCESEKFPYVRLDGTCSAKRRQAMVDRLNDPNDDVFVFLLSSKAGGCGLNLIGANRLILFDPDWNPATDKQAAARVWRDGQKKRTYVYRFFATGTIEEKVYQRQLSKEGLQSVVAEEQNLESMISTSDLKDIFSLQEDTVSDTHDKYDCKRCDKESTTPTAVSIKESILEKQEELNKQMEARLSPQGGENSNDSWNCRKAFSVPVGGRNSKKRAVSTFTNPPATEPPTAPQMGFPNEGDLLEWSHHAGCHSCDDYILRKAGKGLVSFVFGQTIDGEALALKAKQQQEQEEQEAANAAKKDAKKT